MHKTKHLRVNKSRNAQARATTQPRANAIAERKKKTCKLQTLQNKAKN
jgi:hypothetical protein